MPEFFEALKQSIDKGVTTFSVKSKELIETTRINAEIGSLNDRKRALYEALGKDVVALYIQDNLDSESEIKAKCQTVLDLETEIKQKEADLRQIRQETDAAMGIYHCQACDAIYQEDDNFCRKCGTKTKS